MNLFMCCLYQKQSLIQINSIMKNKIYTWSVGLLMLSPLFMACEKDLPVYKPEEARLKFVYEYTRDTLTNYSFAYDNINVDTVWVKVRIMGFPEDRDRRISLKQLSTGENDAVPGTHYVAFDDFIPRNEIERDIPVVLKRDASLKSADYTLRFTFAPNDDFTYGSKERLHKRILIADQLIKPNNWDSYVEHFLGTYGPVKHQFLIDHTQMKWDDKFVDVDWFNYFQFDQMYCFYIQDEMNKELEAYEAEHGTLYEKDNTPVTFPK